MFVDSAKQALLLTVRSVHDKNKILFSVIITFLQFLYCLLQLHIFSNTTHYIALLLWGNAVIVFRFSNSYSLGNNDFEKSLQLIKRKQQIMGHIYFIILKLFTICYLHIVFEQEYYHLLYISHLNLMQCKFYCEPLFQA